MTTNCLDDTGEEAAETYIKLADVHVKLESKSEAASSWVEASKAYQKANSPGEERAQTRVCQSFRTCHLFPHCLNRPVLASIRLCITSLCVLLLRSSRV